MTPEFIAARRRLLTNFPLYAKHAEKIRTKAGQIVPFVLNASQRVLHDAVEEQLLSEGKVRLLILKGRQMGQSTYVGGRLYWRVSQSAAKKAIVVTHHADSTRALFDMTKRFHDLCPTFLRPSTRYSSRRELQFDKLQSGYTVATAGGDSIGRGETFTHGHLSEFAFWPKSSAQANFNGLLQAIPEAPGTEVFIESTANGVSGAFYELWQGAVAGKNRWRAIFLPWTLAEEYREPVPQDFIITTEEEELVRRHGLDFGQLMFRRRKIAESGDELFHQEYPLTPEEAFLTTGRPVFHPKRLVELWDKVRDPIERRALEGADWNEHSLGELLVYHKHDAAETYSIGADIGAGVQRDFSVAQVLDSKRRQAAVWRGQIDPEAFGYLLWHLARYYNDAWICPEANSMGVLPIHILTKSCGYQNVYQETIYNRTMEEETVRMGFQTTQSSKPMVINELRAVVRDCEIEISDRRTLEEMRSFIVTESGRMEGDKGTHDDCVIALALANHINDGGFTPITNEPYFYLQHEE